VNKLSQKEKGKTMQLCSEHGSVCNKVFEHEGKIASASERLDRVEDSVEKLVIRVDSVEGVQKDMVHKLEVAAEGLRALATKIDDAVMSAKNDNGNPSPVVIVPRGRKKFSDQLNEAWDHFASNFARFIIYFFAFGIGWSIWKTITGDWRTTPFFLKPIAFLWGG